MILDTANIWFPIVTFALLRVCVVGLARTSHVGLSGETHDDGGDR